MNGGGLDIHFYDKFGNNVSNDLYFRNPLCSLVNSKKETAHECLLFRTHTIKELNGSQETFLCKYYENLKQISVPITVKGDCIGYLVCSGMQFQITDYQREGVLKKINRAWLF